MKNAYTNRQVIAANVRLHREAKGWTQGELAKRTGLNSGIISKLESRKANTVLATVTRLAHALGVPERQLRGLPEK